MCSNGLYHTLWISDLKILGMEGEAGRDLGMSGRKRREHVSLHIDNVTMQGWTKKGCSTRLELV